MPSLIEPIYSTGPYRFYDEDSMRDIVEDAIARNYSSVKRMAIEAHMSEHTVRKWLNGEHTIKYESLEKIFAVLDALED